MTEPQRWLIPNLCCKRLDRRIADLRPHLSARFGRFSYGVLLLRWRRFGYWYVRLAYMGQRVSYWLAPCVLAAGRYRLLGMQPRGAGRGGALWR